VIRSTITSTQIATSLGGEVRIEAAGTGTVVLALVPDKREDPVIAKVSMEHIECLRLAIETFLKWQAHQ
jgi:hypothetical protein